MSRYILAPSAAADLGAITDFIEGEAGTDRALHVYDEIIEGMAFVADNPAAGFPREHWKLGDVRWWPVFKYLILYDADSRPVEILRVIHGAQDIFNPGRRGVE